MKFLFLDDEREWGDAVETKSGRELIDLVRQDFPNDIPEVFTVRNCFEFGTWLEQNGVPDLVSFDYYLNEWTPVRNGELCARLLRRHCEHEGVPFPKYYIHTSDKYCALKIESAIND